MTTGPSQGCRGSSTSGSATTRMGRSRSLWLCRRRFKCGVNDLPLTLVISWFEQKAVAVLLTLLYLGVKNIRLGPKLPSFVTPNVLALLQERFNLQPIGRDGASDVGAVMTLA
jgi:hypothetical protein